MTKILVHIRQCAGSKEQRKAAVEIVVTETNHENDHTNINP